MALDVHLRTTLQEDARLLLFLQGDGALIGCALHKRNLRLTDADGEILAGTELVVVAIADIFRDSKSPHGGRLVDHVLEYVFQDIRKRNRGDLVSMMARPDNSDGQALIGRLGAERDGVSDGDDVYVMWLSEEVD